MKLNGIEELEQELYLLLGLVCTDCNEEWYVQDNGWIVPKATEDDAKAMVKEYLPKAIELGWGVDIRDNILCPKCNSKL